MNEDAAFIAAIVASQGDDINRLVYADWLDDRDDPRGSYLRAELKWAQTCDVNDEAKARKLAEPLDAVWVARVSRPPLGVCCDCVSFAHHRTFEVMSVTSAELDRFEQQFGITLPPDYRAFLLNYNGGVPDPSKVHRPSDSPGAFLYVSTFHGVHSALPPNRPKLLSEFAWEPDVVSCVSFLEWMRDPERLREPGNYLAAYWQSELMRDLEFIGYSEPNGWNEIYCLGFRGASFGKVFCAASQPHDDNPHGNCVMVADSFAAFLNMLSASSKTTS